MAQQDTIQANGPISTAGDIVQNASSLPEDLRSAGFPGLANQVHDELVDVANKIDQEKQETAGQVEQNLTDSEMQKRVGQAVGWLREPENLLMSFLGFVLFVILIRRL